MTSKVLAEVYRLHHIPVRPITLRELVQSGPRVSKAVAQNLRDHPEELQKWKEMNAPQIVMSAQNLHKQVPIRLARRIVDLENLPDDLPSMTPIVSLREKLIESFDEMISFPIPQNLEGEREFMKMHRRIRDEHATMHSNVSEAVQSLDYEPEGLSESLDSFYSSRIGVRTLVDQHVAAQNPQPGYSGVVCDECSPVQLVQQVVDTVTPLWQPSLSGRTLPEIQVTGEPGATYRCIPKHMELVLSEVLKNAVLNSIHDGSSLSPVSILATGGEKGFCIRVSDLGGGMTREQANTLFSYRQTSSAPGSKSSYDPVAAALERRASGINFLDSFGLRIAQLYAQYFGGDLMLMPMLGHGVDAYIYMSTLTNASEV